MGNTARLREAVRWLNKPTVPSHTELRDMAINCLLANEGDTHVEEDMFRHIVRAYLCALADWEENNDKEIKRTTKQEALDLFRTNYVTGYQALIPAAPAERITEDLSWPDLLDYNAEYSESFIREIGYAFGYRWAKWSLDCKAYIEEKKE